MNKVDNAILKKCEKYTNSEDDTYVVTTFELQNSKQMRIYIEKFDYDGNFMGFVKLDKFNKLKPDLIELKGEK